MSKAVPLLLQYAFMDWAGKIYLLYMPGIISKDNNVCAPFERKHGLIFITYPRHVTRTHSKTEVTTKLRMDILTLNTNLVKIEHKIGTLTEVQLRLCFGQQYKVVCTSKTVHREPDAAFSWQK